MSFGRGSLPGQGRVRSRQAEATRPNRRPAIEGTLRLQRSLGNRTVRQLLRAPSTRPGEFDLPKSAFGPDGLTAARWKELVQTARAATDLDSKKALYTELFQDLARTAGADWISDIDPDYPINIAYSDDTHHRPGLNLVVGAGGSAGGKTGFVDETGKFGVRFDVSKPAEKQHVAVRLYGSSFSEDKAMALNILRHEMTHARHHDLSLTSLREWQRTGAKGTLDEWLKSQKRFSAVDKALIQEDEAPPAKARTELLAYIEGFMTGFQLLDPPAPPEHKIFLELLGVLDGSSVLPWANAGSIVQDEAMARLTRFYCDVLDARHRQAFDAWVDEQRKKVALDEAGGAEATATQKAHHAEQFKEFIEKLKSLRGCATKKPALAR